MRSIRFLRPFVDTSNTYASVNIIYPFRVLNEDKRNLIILVITQSLLSEYSLDVEKYLMPRYYDQLIVKMFPYIIDRAKENPYDEEAKIPFDTERRPGNTYNEWNTSQPIENIEGYELEV